MTITPRTWARTAAILGVLLLGITLLAACSGAPAPAPHLRQLPLPRRRPPPRSHPPTPRRRPPCRQPPPPWRPPIHQRRSRPHGHRGAQPRTGRRCRRHQLRHLPHQRRDAAKTRRRRGACGEASPKGKAEGVMCLRWRHGKRFSSARRSSLTAIRTPRPTNCIQCHGGQGGVEDMEAAHAGRRHRPDQRQGEHREAVRRVPHRDHQPRR